MNFHESRNLLQYSQESVCRLRTQQEEYTESSLVFFLEQQFTIILL